MMINDSDINKARGLMIKDLEIDISPERTTREDLIAFISIQVEELLRNDMSRLMSILYRVDVAETKVKKAFAECNVTLLPFELGRLIFERELQKIESRNLYRR